MRDPRTACAFFSLCRQNCNTSLTDQVAAITKKITVQTDQAVRHVRVQCSLGSSNPAPDHIARVVGGQVDRSLGLQMKTEIVRHDSDFSHDVSASRASCGALQPRYHQVAVHSPELVRLFETALVVVAVSKQSCLLPSTSPTRSKSGTAAAIL